MPRLSPFFGWSWLGGRKPQSSRQHDQHQHHHHIEVHASITSNKDCSCSLLTTLTPSSGTKNETLRMPYHEEVIKLPWIFWINDDVIRNYNCFFSNRPVGVKSPLSIVVAIFALWKKLATQCKYFLAELTSLFNYFIDFFGGKKVQWFNEGPLRVFEVLVLPSTLKLNWESLWHFRKKDIHGWWPPAAKRCHPFLLFRQVSQL